MSSTRYLLALAALPALGFTDCAEFGLVEVPPADSVAPLSCVKIVRPQSAEPPEIHCEATPPRFEATSADRVVVAPFALDAGGVRAMRMYQHTRCDPDPLGWGDPGWVGSVDIPCIDLGKLDGSGPATTVPRLPVRYSCGWAQDLQPGDVGSVVSEGMYLAAEIGAPRRWCGSRGYTVQIETYAIDFWNNESHSFAEVHFTP